jgi:hypothetical protein
MCLLHYTTQILTHPPTIQPLFRDHPYKRPFIGGTASGLLEEASLYMHNLLVSYNKGEFIIKNYDNHTGGNSFVSLRFAPCPTLHAVLTILSKFPNRDPRLAPLSHTSQEAAVMTLLPPPLPRDLHNRPYLKPFTLSYFNEY